MAMTQLEHYQRDKDMLQRVLVHLREDLQQCLNQSAELDKAVRNTKKQLMDCQAGIERIQRREAANDRNRTDQAS